MSVITNLNSTQAPMLAGGLTGPQSVKFIDCPRVYIKSPDATPTPVQAKSNGVLPSGWTDLGIVNGKLKVVYTKEMKEVRTGLDQILRSVYIGKKTAEFDFQLSQFDDVTFQNLTGLTPSILQSGSIVQFPTGQEDVVQKALLLVLQNKLDGKEWQFYSPLSYLSFEITDSGDETVLAGKGFLPAFQWNSLDTYMIQTIYR
jgi:hypothetical protein